MHDSTDPMMHVWVNLPSKTESIVEHKLKDRMAQFNLMQPVMKGIARTEEGDQVPFMCIRVHMHGDSILDGHMGLGVLNTFNLGGKWRSSLCEGDKPSFKEDERSDLLIKGVKDIFKKGFMDLPLMRLIAAQ